MRARIMDRAAIQATWGNVNEQEYQTGVHNALAFEQGMAANDSDHRPLQVRVSCARASQYLRRSSRIYPSLFITTLTITFSDYSGMAVVEPCVTSSFKKHSAMSAVRVVVNITRIIAYPVIAKLSDVSVTC